MSGKKDAPQRSSGGVQPGNNINKHRRRRAPQKSRPPPPPPPPDSLVKLLQSDSQVLAYFQSLRANLEADVEVWKLRASAWKEENEQLKRDQTTQKHPVNGKDYAETKKKRQKRGVDRPPPSPEININDNDGQPIEDSMFEIESSSSSSLSRSNKGKSRLGCSLRSEGGLKTTGLAIQSNEGNCDDLAITDEMFELESGSSSDNSSDDEKIKDASTLPVDCMGGNNSDKSKPASTKELSILLHEAYEALVRLGVPTVNVIEVNEELDLAARNEDSASTAGGREEEEEAPKLFSDIKTSRRPDEQVVADLFFAIKSLTRIQLHDNELMERYPPFNTRQLIPCCNSSTIATDDNSPHSAEQQPPHPAIEGNRLAFRALMTLDTFCSPTVPQSQWDSYFSSSGEKKGKNGTRLDNAKIGLHNRKRLVDQLIQSLDGEISNVWAYADRSTNLITTALHYDMDSVSEEGERAGLNTFEMNGRKLTGGSKSQSRLSTLVERCWLAQMVVALYLSRNDPQSVLRLVFNYILSSVPALMIETHPKLPPTLSFVVLEGLLCPDQSILRSVSTQQLSRDGWFFSCLKSVMLKEASDDAIKVVLEQLALCLQFVASFWRQRLFSSDGRIRDIAQVEMACYERLLLSEKEWIKNEDGVDGLQLSSTFLSERIRLLMNKITSEFSSKSILELNCLALELLLILQGDINCVEQLFGTVSQRSISDQGQIVVFQMVLKVVLRVRRQLEIRRLESYRQQLGSKKRCAEVFPDFSTKFGTILHSLKKLKASEQQKLFGTALTCCGLLSDGETSFRVLQQIFLHHKEPLASDGYPDDEVIDFFDAIGSVGSMPVIRVINLERRSDRWNAFMPQALRDGLLVVRALVDLDEKDPTVPKGYYFGCHAFDGQENLTEQVGSLVRLNTLVETHWCPRDLKVFDRDARKTDDQIRLSPSERACALSHVSSWKGVNHSLQSPATSFWYNAVERKSAWKLFQYRDHLHRQFLVSGFAEGPAMLAENAEMHPTPVCVVIEDDAVLVDRFLDRLRALLKELPRDFHFCSLGYSRPKTAPSKFHLINFPCILSQESS